MDIDLFADMLPEPPSQITLSRRITKKLRSVGIRNIVFIDYDESFGPYVKLFLNKRSRLFSEIDKNPAFLSDLMILSRDTKELLLKDERTLLIFSPIDEKGLRLLIIETTREFRENSYKFLNTLLEKIKNCSLEPMRLADIISNIVEGEDHESL